MVDQYPIFHNAQIRPSTEQIYRNIVDAQYKYSVAKRTSDWENPASVKLLEVINDLVERKDITESTKTPYRAALMWFIKSQPESQQGPELWEAFSALRNFKTPSAGIKSKRRPKVISEPDLDELLNVIDAKRITSLWAPRTAAWISAGLASGLRPVEWIDADWASPEKNSLFVQNAKVKLLPPAVMRRQNVPLLTDLANYRDPFDDMDDEAYDFYTYGTSTFDDHRKSRTVPIPDKVHQLQVQIHLDAFREVVKQSRNRFEQEVQFKIYYARCSEVLRRACRKIWSGKRTYSLVTLRSQFSANMKAAYGAAATAEMMGHYSDESPSTGKYGGRLQAHAGFSDLRMGKKDQLSPSLLKVLSKKAKKKVIREVE